jgi:hypothetical protein
MVLGEQTTTGNYRWLTVKKCLENIDVVTNYFANRGPPRSMGPAPPVREAARSRTEDTFVENGLTQSWGRQHSYLR